MELNWSTFLLEIVNFLVLVWILKHFLYRPVLDVITRRRQSIEDRLGEARHLNEEAESMKAEYENLLVDRERDRLVARQALEEEVKEERARKLAALEAELIQERKKAEAAEARQRESAAQELQNRALQQGARFATRLLEKAAGPELEARLIELALNQISELGPDRLSALKNHWGVPLEKITVATAYPIPDDLRGALEGGLKNVPELNLPIEYVENPGLLAGLQISIGAWELNTNLREELKGFIEFDRATH